MRGIILVLLSIAIGPSAGPNSIKEDPEIKEVRQVLNSRQVSHAVVKGHLETPTGPVSAHFLFVKDPRVEVITVERHLTKMGTNLILMRIPAHKIDKDIKAFLRTMK